VLRKIVRISRENRITSIADFIASRYGKSAALAGIVTVIAVIGIIPYIALQLKAVSGSFLLLANSPEVARPAAAGAGPLLADTAFYAALALEYFRADPAGLDTTEVVRRLKPRYVPFPHEEGTAFQASFGHLDGYSALYYTYMWSLVLAKDLLGAFGGDLLDEATARRYRRCVLEPGGSQDAEVLVASFLGRPFAFDAFERWLAA